MKKTLLITVLLLVVIGIYFVIDYNVDGFDAEEEINVAGIDTTRWEIMNDKYYYSYDFYNSLDLARDIDIRFQSDNVRAGIIPHDITQGQMIAHFFEQISDQKPTRIFLLGPNHHEVGVSKLLTTTAEWQTEFGKVYTDDNIINSLLANRLFSENSEIIENEHSVSAIVPYISYYIPEAVVIPIIFKADIKQFEIDEVIKMLDTYIDDNSVIVAAVDFSHYLTKDQATTNDEITRRYLEDLDYQSVINLGRNFNDYLDSPPVIGLLLKWLDNKGYNSNQIINHTNSADATMNPDILTTSYFEILFY